MDEIGHHDQYATVLPQKSAVASQVLQGTLLGLVQSLEQDTKEVIHNLLEKHAKHNMREFDCLADSAGLRSDA